MTKTEWEQVERELSVVGGCAYLNIDDYEVYIKLRQNGIYENNIFMLINGTVKFDWLQFDCEERRRFFQKKNRAKYVKSFECSKNLTEKDIKSLNRFYDKHKERMVEYSACWSNFWSMQEHFITNNENIELVKVG